jgi:hypothetical protein
MSSIAVGERVLIVGLRAAAQHNFRTGELLARPADDGRLAVELDPLSAADGEAGAGEARAVIRARPSNVLLLDDKACVEKALAAAARHEAGRANGPLALKAAQLAATFAATAARGRGYFPAYTFLWALRVATDELPYALDPRALRSLAAAARRSARNQREAADSIRAINLIVIFLRVSEVTGIDRKPDVDDIEFDDIDLGPVSAAMASDAAAPLVEALVAVAQQLSFCALDDLDRPIAGGSVVHALLALSKSIRKPCGARAPSRWPSRSSPSMRRAAEGYHCTRSCAISPGGCPHSGRGVPRRAPRLPRSPSCSWGFCSPRQSTSTALHSWESRAARTS